MPSLPENRLRLGAVIGALKEAGIRVKNWKHVLNGAAGHGDSPHQESRYSFFSFGRDLDSLPQCHIPEVGGLVPKFLVDACEFLTLHLHTEGLFRKTGSLSRIRSLRAALEEGEPLFCPPRSAVLQPCDIATLVKQFLRELPTPLIPSELQGALCRAQGLGSAADPYGGRDGVVLLVTALFPPSRVRALRYLFRFLRSTAKRSSENRMEVGSLALVIAPNLLHWPPGGSKLTVSTERLLDRQTEVVKVLITHADRIGVVPPFILESMSVTAESLLTNGIEFEERVGLSVYSSVRRQRRRSVGEMFVEALSKLKTGRTPNGHPQSLDGMLGQCSNSTPPVAHAAKRKSTDDTLPEVEGSAKKRRSVHDLREDGSATRPCLDECAVAPSESSLPSSAERGEEQELLALANVSEKRRSHKRNAKKTQRLPMQDNGEGRRRRRSLRFFTLTGWGSPSTAVPADREADSWLTSRTTVIDSGDEPASSEGALPFKIPVILIEGPGGAVVGTEVEDDPELLNCSFVEDPHYRLQSGGPPSPTKGTGGKEEHVEDGMEPRLCIGRNYSRGRSAAEGGKIEVEHREEPEKCPGEDEGWGTRRRDATALCRSPDIIHKAVRPPRRSISLPDVSTDAAGRQDEGDGEERASLVERVHPVLESTVDGSMQLRGNSVPVWGERLGEQESEEAGLDQDGLIQAGPGEEGLGLKRSSQRMSVAEHVRRFNALTGWRTDPDAGPVPEIAAVAQQPQQAVGPRGAVRLRRQGARRFSRSISHEGVSVLLQGQSATRLPLPRVREPPTAEQERLCSAPPLARGASARHRCAQSQPSLQENPRGLRVSQKAGREGLRARHATVDKSRLQELGRPHCRVRLQNGCTPLLQIPEQEKPTQGVELHRLLELQLQLQEPASERRVLLHQRPRDPSRQSCVPLQRDLREPREQVRALGLLFPCPPTNGAAEPSRRAYTSEHVSQTPPPDPGSVLQTGPLVACPLQSETPFSDTPPLSADSLFECGFKRVNGESKSSTVSPPALQFQAPATRRQYRDSPRWPISEIRISTWNPLQL